MGDISVDSDMIQDNSSKLLLSKIQHLADLIERTSENQGLRLSRVEKILDEVSEDVSDIKVALGKHDVALKFLQNGVKTSQKKLSPWSEALAGELVGIGVKIALLGIAGGLIFLALFRGHL